MAAASADDTGEIMDGIVRLMNTDIRGSQQSATAKFGFLVEKSPKFHFTLKTWTADKGEELKKCNMPTIDGAIDIFGEAKHGVGRWSDSGKHHDPRTAVVELWLAEAGACQRMVFSADVHRRGTGVGAVHEHTRLNNRDERKTQAQFKRDKKN